MNLDQIATKCFILALFIRDDGERLLLGDGFYDFNQKLQHFQANTIANDVVEIQGDNGQLLAGQVMRSGAQKFEGYIGDATTNRQTIEQKRSDFMAFFRIKHFYKVIYIFPDGTAIQRQRGYLTDAPTIPEIFQKFPEYSVALNFEDANYYEYAEDEHGDEIYAHIAELALAGGATGGLIWDAIGAVTNGITWSGIQTAQGEYIQITNDLDIPAKLASVEMLGKAEQIPPQGYQFVEYIESTGTQYIKTGVTSTSGQVWSAELTMQYTSTPSYSSVLLSPGANSWFGQNGGFYAIGGSFKLTTSATTKATAQVSFGANVSATINGETLTRTMATDAGEFCIFTAGNGAGYSSSAKLYSCKMYNSAGTMVRNFLPCYRKSDNVVGLYDFVNHTFYANAGTGTFTKGANIDLTPAPDAPQPISVVTGENVVKIEGKNLFDKNAITSGKLIDRNTGVLNNNSSYATSDFMLVQAGKRYTFTGFNYWYAAGFDKNKNYLTTLPNYATYTIPEGVAYIRAGLLLTNLDTAQFEQNDQATAYEPYQGQEFEVNLGKNLLSPTELPKTQAGVTGTYQNGIFSLSGTASVASNFYILPYTTQIAHLETGESITFYLERVGGTSQVSFLCYFIPDDGSATEYNWRCDLGANESSKTFTKTATKAGKLQAVQFFISNGVTYDIQFKVLVQMGNIANPTWAEYFTPIELAKIGNYQDRIYKEDSKWYIEKQVGKVVLDGTNADIAWSLTAQTSVYSFWYRNIAMGALDERHEKLCDRFTYSPRAFNGGAPIPSLCENAYGGYVLTIFKTDGSQGTTVAEWESWLSTHPTTVYYALATPTTTEITNEALIAQLDALGASSLYLGVNNIGTETLNAMPTLKIEYYTEYTLEGAGYEWEPGGNTARTIVTVAGVDSAWPIWTIQGGAQNPTLTNITTGQTISWQGFVPEGQTLTINMAEMTADLAGANVFEYITGEWLRLAPGNNTLVYNAGSADKPSTLSWNGVLA